MRNQLFSGVVCAGLFVVGCDDAEVKTYDVDKAKATTQQVASGQSAAKPQAVPPVAPMTQPAMPMNTGNVPAPTPAAPIPWTVPESWERVPGERPMRVATFRRNGVEVAVSQFPGNVGGTLANVNRWRNQVGLESIQEADLAKELKPFDNGKMKGHTMRLRGAQQQHMLGAIIADPANDRLWFVKSTTTPANADAAEAEFESFAKSFGVGGSSASGGAATPSTRPATTAPATTQPLDNK